MGDGCMHGVLWLWWVGSRWRLTLRHRYMRWVGCASSRSSFLFFIFEILQRDRTTLFGRELWWNVNSTNTLISCLRHDGRILSNTVVAPAILCLEPKAPPLPFSNAGKMPISEEKYLAWCEKMAAKAALERSLHATPSGHEAVNESSPSSNTSNMQRGSITKPTRRRTMSDPKMIDTEKARTGTWPRCASESMAQATTKPRPLIPRRRSSQLSTSPRNRTDLRSFHRESCQLFSSMDATMTDSGYSSVHRAGSSTFASTASFPQLMVEEHTPRCSISLERPLPVTVVSWKSEATRRVEYEKIDEANSGLRGLCKKILPKCCQSRRTWRRFFEGKCDGDSVRRMRMPFSDEKTGN